MVDGKITYTSRVTLKMAWPFPWKGTLSIVRSCEAIISSLCEDFCVLSLRITVHCEGSTKHLLIYYASCQITVRAAALAREQGTALAAGLRLSLSPWFFSDANISWYMV